MPQNSIFGEKQKPTKDMTNRAKLGDLVLAKNLAISSGIFKPK